MVGNRVQCVRSGKLGEIIGLDRRYVLVLWDDRNLAVRVRLTNIRESYQ